MSSVSAAFSGVCLVVRSMKCEAAVLRIDTKDIALVWKSGSLCRSSCSTISSTTSTRSPRRKYCFSTLSPDAETAATDLSSPTRPALSQLIQCHIFPLPGSHLPAPISQLSRPISHLPTPPSSPDTPPSPCTPPIPSHPPSQTDHSPAAY